MRRALLLLAVAVAAAGCSRDDPDPPPPRGSSLRAAATAHLRALAQIGERNDNTRAAGTPGFDASVDYVAGRLRDAGYRVTLQEVPFPVFRDRSRPRLEAGGRSLPVQTLRYSGAGARARAGRARRAGLPRGRLRGRPRPDRRRGARALHVPREGAARRGGRARAGWWWPTARASSRRAAR